NLGDRLPARQLGPDGCIGIGRRVALLMPVEDLPVTQLTPATERDRAGGNATQREGNHRELLAGEPPRPVQGYRSRNWTGGGSSSRWCAYYRSLRPNSRCGRRRTGNLQKHATARSHNASPRGRRWPTDASTGSGAPRFTAYQASFVLSNEQEVPNARCHARPKGDFDYAKAVTP